MRTILAALCVALILGCNKTSTNTDATLDEIEKVTRQFVTLAETGEQIPPAEFNALAEKQRNLYNHFSQSLERGIHLTARQQKKWREIDALNKTFKRAEYSSETQRIVLKE